MTFFGGDLCLSQVLRERKNNKQVLQHLQTWVLRHLLFCIKIQLSINLPVVFWVGCPEGHVLQSKLNPCCVAGWIYQPAQNHTTLTYSVPCPTEIQTWALKKQWVNCDAKTVMSQPFIEAHYWQERGWKEMGERAWEGLVGRVVRVGAGVILGCHFFWGGGRL